MSIYFWFIFLANCFLVIVSAMAELVTCEPFELYNLLNQCSCVSRLAEINYLCLIGKCWDFNAGICESVYDHLMWARFSRLPCFNLISLQRSLTRVLHVSFPDARETQDYRISHIVTSKNVKMVWKPLLWLMSVYPVRSRLMGKIRREWTKVWLWYLNIFGK